MAIPPRLSRFNGDESDIDALKAIGMQHCLGVDIGNSGLRVAELQIHEGTLGEMLRVNWRSPIGEAIRCGAESPRRYLPDEPAWLAELETYLAGAVEQQAPPIVHWFISSVRRDALQVLLNFLANSPRHQVEIVTYDLLPLQVHVDFPELVGIDRLLAALAATELTSVLPAIVVQAGSAVTVDLVSAAAQELVARTTTGRFEGGAILPGVPMMLRLLGRGADMLPEIDADDLLQLPSLPGKSTEAAMICGTASALVGGVQHLVQRYRSQYGQQVPVILSGGDGMRLSPYLPQPVIVKPHLVHCGLLKFAERYLARA